MGGIPRDKGTICVSPVKPVFGQVQTAGKRPAKMRMNGNAPLFTVGGGGIAWVVGCVCSRREKGERHYIVPLHAEIQERTRKLGIDCLQPIISHKIANGVTEVQGNGACLAGKPYHPGGVIKNDVEYI